MMRRDITAFISELLYRHDCVILPGFGGFIGNYTPAFIDKSSNTFNPPVKQISFNRNLNHNDGLLIGKISESLSINYGDARSIVNDFVSDLRKKLSGGNSVSLDAIGTFSLNSEGNPLFEPDRSANYLPGSYGLASYHLTPSDHFDTREAHIARRIKAAGSRTTLRKIMWRAAVVIPFTAALIFVPLKYDLLKGKVERSSMNPLLTAQIEDNNKAVEEAVISPDIAATPSEISEDQPEEVPVVIMTAVSYKVIAGSFKDEVNARRLVEKLTGMGYNPEVKKLDSGFYRVSMIEFNNLEEALKFRSEAMSRFPGIWISKEA